jgi:hypothetical protein
MHKFGSDLRGCESCAVAKVLTEMTAYFPKTDSRRISKISVNKDCPNY